MRTLTGAGVAFGILLTTHATILSSSQGKQTETERTAHLIKQLGDASFAKRQAASKELEGIGEPVLGSLRKAAIATDDPEVRRRLEETIDAINARIRAAAVAKELAKWQGTWEDRDQNRMTFKGDRWTSGTPTFGPVSGSVNVIELRPDLILVDLQTEEGQTKGVLVKAIIRVEGDTLHYCGTYGQVRPAEFKTSPGGVYYALNRAKK
jgi:hypothetical protein